MLLVEREFLNQKKEGRENREGEGEEKVCRGVEFEHLGLLTPAFKTLTRESNIL